MTSNSPKWLIPVAAFFAIWLVWLTWLVVGTQPTLADQAESSGGPVVAFVHGDSLQEGMAFVQTLKANLEVQIDAREERLQADAAPLQEEAQELLDYAQGGSATPEELDIAQRRIMELEDALRAMQRAAEQDVVVAEQNMKSILAEALRRNLKAHAEEEGIDFILNWGLSGEGVLYGKEPWDITSEVLDRINSATPQASNSDSE